jgi:hypothetical protein
MPNATSDSASIYLARNALAKGEGERVERGTYVYSPCVEQEGEREREREREKERVVESERVQKCVYCTLGEVFFSS